MANKLMKRYSVFWGIQEMQIKLQIDKGGKDIKFSRGCWEKMGVRGERISSFSGRRQRPVTRTGWVRTCGEARTGVRTPTV